MGKFSYVLKNTLLNMRRTPLLVFATIIAVLVSSFLVFTTLSARSIVENNTIRWQNGIHVVVFLDDRVTTTAHKQLQESLNSYLDVAYANKDTASHFSLGISGLEMLLWQAVGQQRLFRTGQFESPLADEVAVVAAMRSALDMGE